MKREFNRAIYLINSKYLQMYFNCLLYENNDFFESFYDHLQLQASVYLLHAEVSSDPSICPATRSSGRYFPAGSSRPARAASSHQLRLSEGKRCRRGRDSDGGNEWEDVCVCVGRWKGGGEGPETRRQRTRGENRFSWLAASHWYPAPPSTTDLTLSRM